MSSIDNIESRIRQIEMKIDRGPSINSSAFNELMAGQQKAAVTPPATGVQPNAAVNKLNYMSGMNRVNFSHIQPANTSEVKPLAQSNGISCGQTSVAMCINSLTGGSMTDNDVNANYGFGLLNALKSESAKVGYDWRDAGNISSDNWALIDQKVNQEKLPVMVALNGPEFSPSGRGHIVTIVKTEGENVTFADPATGALRTTTKTAMQTAPSHPDGNFVFVADKMGSTPPPVAAAPPTPAPSPVADFPTDEDEFGSATSL